MTRTSPPRRPIQHSLWLAGLVLGAAAALKFLAPDQLNSELPRRLFGFVTGVVVVVYSNASARALTPLSRMRWDPVAEQAVRRFTAWSLTLGGAAHALTWMVVPMDSANVVAVSLLGTSLLLPLVRCVWCVAIGVARGARRPGA